MPNKNWFTMRTASDGSGEISILSDIGAWGITAQDFGKELRALGSPRTLRVWINSNGGAVFDAIAIYNMLMRHSARVEVAIEGVAASAASLVAMAGDEISMPANTFMMIHNPAGVAFGNSRRMRDVAATLDKITSSMVDIYAERSGLEASEVRRMMDEETWFTAAEAVEQGFADTLEEEIQIAASAVDLSRFKNPPELETKEPTMTKTPTTTPTAETPEQMEARLRERITAELTEQNATAATAAAAPAAAAPAAAPAVPDEAAMRANIRDEAANIIAMCKLAGKPEAAAEFIAKGAKPYEVLAELGKAQATTASNVRTDANTQVKEPGQSAIPDKVVTSLDPGKIYANWNGARRRTA